MGSSNFPDQTDWERIALLDEDGRMPSAEVEPGWVREVAELVAEFPQVTYVACAAGDSDVSISLRVRTIEELFHFVDQKLGKISGVRRTHSYILPLKLKDLDTCLPPGVPDSDDGSGSKDFEPAQSEDEQLDSVGDPA